MGRFNQWLTRQILRLPDDWLIGLHPRGFISVDGQDLDPQMHAVCYIASRMRPMPTMTASRARLAFEYSAGLLKEDPFPVASVTDAGFGGPRGPVSVRVYNPSPETRDLPMVVYFHGGGFVVGSLDSHDTVTRRIATHCQAIVVAVDYRMAPDFRFPAAVDDALAVWRNVATHAAELGGDPGRIAVMGDSAGGNLAAVVSLLARDGGLPAPCAQVLIYPATDLAGQTRSMELFSTGFVLETATMEWFKDNYAPDKKLREDWRMSPLRAPSLAGLPPAHIVTAGFDPLRDEGAAYAERLKEEGVEVTYRCFPSLVHGFFGMSGGVRAAEQAVIYTLDHLKQTFATLPSTAWS